MVAIEQCPPLSSLHFPLPSPCWTSWNFPWINRKEGGAGFDIPRGYNFMKFPDLSPALWNRLIIHRINWYISRSWSTLLLLLFPCVKVNETSKIPYIPILRRLERNSMERILSQINNYSPPLINGRKLGEKFFDLNSKKGDNKRRMTINN